MAPVVSDEIMLAMIVGVPPTLGAIATVILAIKTGRKIEAVHKATNSMKDALVKSTGDEAFARGHKEGSAGR